MVTGGAGFIGSALVRYLVHDKGLSVLNVDKLTYAACLASLEAVAGSTRYRFLQVDISNAAEMNAAFAEFAPDAVVHLAAESHVDRSISDATPFIETNIVGTHVLLEAARRYWEGLPGPKRNAFRFLHVSTDEVYGTLGATGLFDETTPYAPNSPYAASKASADHLVRSYRETYGLPTLITNCSNNYGPYQYPEKLIPLMTLNALEGLALPIYGDGMQVRNWIYAEDFSRGIGFALEHGVPGEVYNVGGPDECPNLEVVQRIIEYTGASEDLIEYVTDRPGHDRRYSLSSDKIRALGWEPQVYFADGLKRTVEWYRENTAWWEPIRSGDYREYYERQYGRSLG